MKFLFTLLSFAFFSISTCQGSFGSELENQCQQNLKTLLSIAVKVNRLKEDDYTQYFNSDNIDKFIVNKYKNVMRESVDFYRNFYNQIPWTKIKTKEEASSYFLIPYFQMFHLPMALSELKSSSLPNSYFDHHLKESLAAYNFLPLHFTSLSKDISQTVKITKKQINKDGIQPYSIHLNLVATFLLQKRRALNLITRLKTIDINKLKLPPESKKLSLGGNCSYGDLLKKSIKNTMIRLFDIAEHNIVPFLEGCPDINYNGLKEIDFSQTDNCYLGPIIPNFLSYNVEILSDAERLAYKPLHQADYGLDGALTFLLTPEEIELNKPLVQAMIEEGLLKASQKDSPAPIAQPQGRAGKNPSKAQQKTRLKNQKADSRRKTKGKKKGKPALPPQQRKETRQDSALNASGTTHHPVAITAGSSTPALVPPLKGDELPNGALSPLYTPGVAPTSAFEGMEKEEDRPGIEKEKEKEKEVEAPVTNEEIDEDPVASTRAWLQEILDNSHNYFMIRHKAQSLLRDLGQTNSYLLEQIQEATSGLALQLQQSQTTSQVNKSLIVPQKMESAFRYFRDTPIPYLKGTRMGFVTALLEGLGVQIDKSREGSRVHMSYQNQHTSLHIHDKNNGALDGGRLNSLRKFLLDIGFFLKDDIIN